MKKIIAFLLVVTLFPCCDIFKHKYSETSQETNVAKQTNDLEKEEKSGSVAKTELKSINETDWERLILLMANRKDTTINNHFTQPAKIIYEKGNSRTESGTKSYDSSWQVSLLKMLSVSFDSLAKKIEIKEKVKETKGPDLFDWAGIAALVVVLLRAFFNFKIVRN